MPMSPATVPSFLLIISENPRHNKRNSENRITSRHRGRFTKQLKEETGKAARQTPIDVFITSILTRNLWDAG